MTNTWKNKMIEQGFNFSGSTVKKVVDFFKVRVENLNPKQNMKQENQNFTNKTKKKKEEERRCD